MNNTPEGSGRFGFPRKCRLTRKSEYDIVFRQGRKWVGANLVCYILLKPEGESRLGLAVSRKVGKATVRNRIKRCVRETFRRVRPEFQARVDVVVVARPVCAQAHANHIAADLLQALKERGAWNG